MTMYVLFCLRCLRWNEVSLIAFCRLTILPFSCSNVIMKSSMTLLPFSVDVFHVRLNSNTFREILCTIGGPGGSEIFHRLTVFHWYHSYHSQQGFSSDPNMLLGPLLKLLLSLIKCFFRGQEGININSRFSECLSAPLISNTVTVLKNISFFYPLLLELKLHFDRKEN